MFSINELLEATGGKLVSQAAAINVEGISIDTRTIRPNEAFIAIKGSNFDGHSFINEALRKGATCVVKEAVSIGTKKIERIIKNAAIIEVKSSIKALGDIAGFWRKKFNIPVIAITGSNGKTTTKEMVAHLLSKKFRVLKNEGTKNNQIGLPLTLIKLDGSYDIAILEIGTNHFGEVDYLAKVCQPNIGIITNIGPSHLEYLDTLEGVFKEKYRLIENLQTPGIGILNADDNFLQKKLFRSSQKPIILGFGIKNRSDFCASDIKILDEKIEFLVNKKYRFTPLDRRSKINNMHRHLTGFTLKALGYYNIYNALAAVAVARIFGINYSDMAKSMLTFDFPEGRLKLIRINNTTFIDDTYNSNPLSLIQALKALVDFKAKGRKIFIMGDMLELGDDEEKFHCQSGRLAARRCDIFIAVGKLSKLAAQAANKSGLNTRNIFTCRTPKEAGDILFNSVLPKEDDVVLVKGSRSMKMEEAFK